MLQAQAGKRPTNKIVAGKILELHSLCHPAMITPHLDSKLLIITRQHASIGFLDKLRSSQQRLVETLIRDKIAQAIMKNIFRFLV